MLADAAGDFRFAQMPAHEFGHVAEQHIGIAEAHALEQLLEIVGLDAARSACSVAPLAAAVAAFSICAIVC